MKNNSSINIQKPSESNGQENKFHQNRRYVGTKETVAYIVYDMSQSFNINAYQDKFVTNILQIHEDLQSIMLAINGVWDIINDLFTGAIVDKTRTRWGKFKPYLMFLAVPGTILSMIYWILPMFFTGTDEKHMGKFAAYLILALIREGIGTFQGIAQTGIQATITPHPVDRTRLITLANFLSGFLGENLPDQIMTFATDLIDNGVLKISHTRLYVGLGCFTVIVAGAGAFWFFSICKERVMQSVEKPSVLQGIKTIAKNKPLFLIALSEMLGGFEVGKNKKFYYHDVLKFGTLELIAGIPGAIVHPISYAIVPWFKRHFSSRTLYIIGKYIGNFLYVPVFLFGAKGGIKNGMYKRVVPMGIALTLWEMVFMVFYGVRKVVPTEMYNECMDYCELKDGYRSEAVISVARGLAKKLANIAGSITSLQLRKLYGYDITKYKKGQAQTDKAKFGLFSQFTIIPFITSILGIIPMLFYDLDGEKREKMYEELFARRELIARTRENGDDVNDLIG